MVTNLASELGHDLVELGIFWWLNIAMEHGPFTDDVPIENGNSIAMPGTDLWEVPTIYKAYIRPM